MYCNGVMLLRIYSRFRRWFAALSQINPNALMLIYMREVRMESQERSSGKTVMYGVESTATLSYHWVSTPKRRRCYAVIAQSLLYTSCSVPLISRVSAGKESLTSRPQLLNLHQDRIHHCSFHRISFRSPVSHHTQARGRSHSSAPYGQHKSSVSETSSSTQPADGDQRPDRPSHLD